MQTEQLMKRAIELSLQGASFTYPNPIVGAVIADSSGQIISEGFHKGAEHAEVLAINNAKSIPADATLFVTLEPCNHFGKTPPCTDAIIASGIRNVVFATTDPNPVAAGGANKLIAAGVNVTSGLLANEAAIANRAWLTKMEKGRARFIWKIASTLDGKVAAQDGSSKWITSSQSRADVAKLRAESDAILTSSKTVIADNPTLDSKGIGSNPYRIVMGQSKLDSSANIFNDLAKTKVIESRDFTELLDFVKSEGFNQVLVEAGPNFGSAMLAAGLIDEIVIYIAPAILGNGLSSITDLGIKSIDDKLQLSLISQQIIDQDIKITYQVEANALIGAK
jgi:diaminohydroxyphosphoribosylaminopyrimidine deaminase / 5-amino-6-(5-phosphoribosylamino)uracil reductase